MPSIRPRADIKRMTTAPEPDDAQRACLVVEDDPALLPLLTRQLRRIGFDVDKAASLNEARRRLTVKHFELVVCHLDLSDGSGLEFLREARDSDGSAGTVLISGDGWPESLCGSMADDVDAYLVKPFGNAQLAVTVEQALRRRRERSAPGPLQLLEHLGRAGKYRDEETAEHVERMSRSSALIASQMGWDPEECIELRTATALHDIGKVGVPDSVLRKPGKLNHEERALIERHPEMGYEILRGSDDPVMALASTVALTHHERFDGTGYPRRLSRHEIPIAGRIAAVADVFDALTHDRAYRAAFTPSEGLAALREGSGTHFDPAVVAAFEEVAPQVEEMGARTPDGSPELELEETPSAAIRVLIVEDHDAMARGIELLLRRDGFEVAGSARNLTEATRILERRDVDIVLVDLQLGDEDGLDLVPAVKAHSAQVLVYTGRLDSAAVASARRAGADGVAAKAAPPGELVAALRSVVDGEAYCDPRFEREPDGAMPSLTPRESEIVALLASGLNGEEIARRLFVTPATVRTHIRNAMDRVDARTRAHLVTLAARQGVRPAPRAELALAS
jgi:putative two-component system response regulator